MGKKATIVIKGELPDLNKIIELSKMGRGRRQPYNTVKQEYTDAIAWQTRSQTKEKFKKIDIDITFICKNRRKDKDNIMAGTKFILDGLVRAGTIKNDGWKQVGDISFKFKVDKDNPRIIVDIEEVSK